jgi:hypothetical protein
MGWESSPSTAQERTKCADEGKGHLAEFRQKVEKEEKKKRIK